MQSVLFRYEWCPSSVYSSLMTWGGCLRVSNSAQHRVTTIRVDSVGESVCEHLHELDNETFL